MKRVPDLQAVHKTPSNAHIVQRRPTLCPRLTVVVLLRYSWEPGVLAAPSETEGGWCRDIPGTRYWYQLCTMQQTHEAKGLSYVLYHAPDKISLLFWDTMFVRVCIIPNKLRTLDRNFDTTYNILSKITIGDPRGRVFRLSTFVHVHPNTHIF